jgi:LPS O-antigen subunit length determinant protein (WzzB/FepE family)
MPHLTKSTSALILTCSALGVAVVLGQSWTSQAADDVPPAQAAEVLHTGSQVATTDIHPGKHWCVRRSLGS